MRCSTFNRIRNRFFSLLTLTCVTLTYLQNNAVIAQATPSTVPVQNKLETQIKSVDKMLDRAVQKVLNKTKGSIPSDLKERVIKEFNKKGGLKIDSNELLNKINNQIPISIKNKLPKRFLTKLEGVKMNRMEKFSYWPGLVDQAHLMSLYTPLGGKKYPLIIYVHGGGWYSRPKSPPNWLAQAVKRGYAVAIVNYRLSQESTKTTAFPAAIEDLNTAIRFIKSRNIELNIDPERIGLWGTSAGAHLAALLATSASVSTLDFSGGDNSIPRKVRALVDFCGPTDLFTLGSSMAPGQSWDTVSSSSPLSQFLGGRAIDNKEKALMASPISYVSASCPTALIVHGKNDNIVPSSQSEKFVEMLRASQVPVEFLLLDGQGHDIERGFNIEIALSFFDKTLKN